MRFLLTTTLLILATAPAGAAETVLTVDGRAIQGDLVAIDNKQVTVQVGGQTTAIARDDVLSIAFGERPAGNLMAEAGRHILTTDDGGQLSVTNAAIADGKLTATSPVAGKICVPLEHVARLLAPRANETPADVQREVEALRLPREARDYVVISKKPGQYAPVAGILKSLDDRRLLLNYDGTDTAMDAAAIAAIQVARVGASAPAVAGHLTTAAGERLGFTALAVKDNTVHLTSPAFGTVKMPVAQVASLRFRSDRVTYLSDLEPAAAQQSGYLGDVFAYARDKAADGGPLRLGGSRYEKGLGLHTRCELVYDLGGAYRHLVATAGIDDGSPFGSAFLTILGDGRPLAAKVRLDRKAAPQALRIDVAGVKRLTLLADYGDGSFGAGERVDLADAKLIK